MNDLIEHLANDRAFKEIVEAATDYIDQAVSDEAPQNGLAAYKRISCVPGIAVDQALERAKADGRFPSGPPPVTKADMKFFFIAMALVATGLLVLAILTTVH